VVRRLLIVLALASCRGLPATADSGAADSGCDDGGVEARISAARAAWTRVKPTCNPYHYDTYVGSLAFGSCDYTFVEITNGALTRLAFIGYTYDTCGRQPAAGVIWDRTGAQLAGDGGAVALSQTIEQLLDRCATATAACTPGSIPVFDALDSGVPTMCGKWCPGCVDGQYDGLELHDFGCGPLVFDAGLDVLSR
jgi:hypothetical protein